MKPLFYILVVLVLIPFNSSAQKESISKGTVSNGSLVNGARLPFRGPNYRYFMRFSYSILNRAYVHSRVKKITLDTYKECETFCKGQKFYIMECSKKKGGKMPPHRTHQNGTSIDFATPLVKKGKQYSKRNIFNLHGYRWEFNADGTKKGNSKVEIDFETMAKHLYMLDIVCRKNGMKISKVIFNMELQKKLFETEYGKKLRARMYFVKSLTPILNKYHDEHYHVDFELVE